MNTDIFLIIIFNHLSAPCLNVPAPCYKLLTCLVDSNEKEIMIWSLIICLPQLAQTVPPIEQTDHELLQNRLLNAAFSIYFQ